MLIFFKKKKCKSSFGLCRSSHFWGLGQGNYWGTCHVEALLLLHLILTLCGRHQRTTESWLLVDDLKKKYLFSLCLSLPPIHLLCRNASFLSKQMLLPKKHMNLHWSFFLDKHCPRSSQHSQKQGTCNNVNWAFVNPRYRTQKLWPCKPHTLDLSACLEFACMAKWKE